MPLKTLDQLTNGTESAWPMVQQWIAAGTNPIEVLPTTNEAAREKSLLETQVTTRSPMGAVVYETGGILVDHGWLRILGSGHPRLPRSLPAWNQGRTVFGSGTPPPFYLVADDAIGGFFAIDGGGLGAEPGKVCYFAPDSLKWENTRRGYTDFLVFCFSGNLAQFYQDVRWPGWEEEVGAISGHQVISIYPWMSTKGPPVAERHRKPVPIEEIYRLFVDAGNATPKSRPPS
jgi:hypothetical protein